eukprot:IDg16741t1
MLVEDVQRGDRADVVYCARVVTTVRRWTGTEAMSRSVQEILTQMAAYNAFMREVDRMDQLREVSPHEGLNKFALYGRKASILNVLLLFTIKANCEIDWKYGALYKSVFPRTRIICERKVLRNYFPLQTSACMSKSSDVHFCAILSRAQVTTVAFTSRIVPELNAFTYI